MEKEYNIKIHNMAEITKIVNDCKKFSSDIDAQYENRIVDAKSLIGMSLMIGYTIILRINSDDYNELVNFNLMCKNYKNI